MPHGDFNFSILRELHTSAGAAARKKCALAETFQGCWADFFHFRYNNSANYSYKCQSKGAGAFLLSNLLVPRRHPQQQYLPAICQPSWPAPCPFHQQGGGVRLTGHKLFPALMR